MRACRCSDWKAYSWAIRLSGSVTLCLLRKSEKEPKPLRLLQMIAVGIPLRGPKRKLSSAATTPPNWVASTVCACQPKERNTVSSSGMGKTMRVCRSSCPLLRSTSTQRLSRWFWPAYITASQIGPSCSSPSPVGIGIKPRTGPTGDGKTLGHTKALPHRSRGNMHPRQDRARMSVQNAGKRARVLERLAVEIAKFGIDRGQRSHRMALAQGENILPATRGIFDVQFNEASVEQGNQRDDGREGAACVQSFIDGIAALFQGKQTDVGILDGQQLQDALAHGVIV